MKYLSLFTGIGGFEAGIQRAYESSCDADGGENGGGETDTARDEGSGLLTKKGKGSRAKEGRTRERSPDHPDERPLCIGYSEIDRYATSIYEKHYPSHKKLGDITLLATYNLPHFDLLVGGFPCQSFSIAGQRKGFDDTRGTLFFEIARIVRDKRPRLLLLENVKGLLSHDKGQTFRVIIAALDELGYDLQWQVLNSKNFGVPQNRERVFIVGHLRGTPRPEVFPWGGDGEAPSLIPRHISNTLTARYEGAQAVGTYIGEGELHAQEIRQANKPKHSNDRVYEEDGISPTLNTMQGGRRQPKILGKGMSIRRLTPTECERLQGFDDGWTAGVSDTQRYKCLGNAVTVNVIEAIMKKIL